jgi:hypothetical protein
MAYVSAFGAGNQQAERLGLGRVAVIRVNISHWTLENGFAHAEMRKTSQKYP